MDYEVPRRNRLDQFTPAEKAIWDATQAVEAAGAHPLLTEAVILLGQAREKVADFVDLPLPAPPTPPEPLSGPWTQYTVDYEYGEASFWRRGLVAESPEREVLREFFRCANECFGIRKSLGQTRITTAHEGVVLPLPFQGVADQATHCLTHHGDEILFDARFQTPDGDLWKLHNEAGEWCSCRERGAPELSCAVHHFWVPNHDAQCTCNNR